MDIRNFAVEPTTRLHLRNANDELMFASGADGKPDENLPMAVVLYGPGSKPFKRAQAVNTNRALDRLKSKGKSTQTADEQTKENAEFLAACTKQFENVEYEQLQGEAKAVAIYSDFGLGFIAEQVQKHLQDWANFTKAAQPS